MASKSGTAIGWAATQVYRFPTQRARSTDHLDSLHEKKAFSHCPTFIDSWKGLNLLLSETCIRRGEFIDQQWFHRQWHHSDFNVSVMVKELVPITSSCAVWGPRFSKTSPV